MIQDVAREVPEQLTQGLRPVEHMAAREPIDLTEILLAFRQLPLRDTHG